MEKREIVNQSICTIANVIVACRIATGGKYEVTWLDDHFACRRCDRKNTDGIHLVYLLCQDINEGLPSDKWDIIRSAVRSLVKREVVK